MAETSSKIVTSWIVAHSDSKSCMAFHRAPCPLTYATLKVKKPILCEKFIGENVFVDCRVAVSSVLDNHASDLSSIPVRLIFETPIDCWCLQR